MTSIAGINPNFRLPTDIFSAASPTSGGVINNSAAGSSWGSILPEIAKQGANTAFTILTQRFGGPQPGQYFQTRDGVAYNIPGNIPTVGVFPGQGFNLNSQGLFNFVLLGGIVLAVVSIAKK